MRKDDPSNVYELFLLRIASGKHPISGEKLPDHSPWKNREIISAVQEVLGVSQEHIKLEGSEAEGSAKRNDRLERIRARHPNAYKPWTEDQEIRLVSMWENGADISEIANEIGRGSGGIRSRLEKLGYEDLPEEEEPKPRAATETNDDIEVVDAEEESLLGVGLSCRECGDTIPEARLNAVPETELCTACATTQGFEKQKVTEPWGTREDFKKDRASWMPWKRK